MAFSSPHPKARNIRFSYTVAGGPSAASFTVPNDAVSGFALGSGVTLSRWTGRVVAHRRFSAYETEIICAGYARELDTIRFNCKFNRTLSDGSQAPGSVSVSDAGQIATEVGSQAGISVGTLTLGFTPVEAEVSGSVSSVLSTLAQAGGRAWYYNGSTVTFPAISFSSSSDPGEVSIEGLVNRLVIEGGPKPQFDRSYVAEDEIPQKEWEYLASPIIGYNSSTGEEIKGSPDAKYHSPNKIYVIEDTGSIAAYGVREAFVSVPFVGDWNGATSFATAFFSIFSVPKAVSEHIEYIETGTEPLPWEVGAENVDVDVLPTGALKVTYRVSLGDLLASKLYRGNLVRPFDRVDPTKDTDPPSISVADRPSNSRPVYIGSPMTVYARAVDKKPDDTEVGVPSPPVLEISQDPKDFSSPLSYTMSPVPDDPDGTSYPNWYYVTVDLKSIVDGNGQAMFPRGAPIAYRVRAVDDVGNVGFSGITEGIIDAGQPVLSMSLGDYDPNQSGQPLGKVEPLALTHGFGEIQVTIQDPSSIEKVVCSHLYDPATQTVSEGELTRVPSEWVYNAADGTWEQTNEYWKGVVKVTGVEKVVVWARDVYGNRGETWIYARNTDDPIPPEWDHSPPRVTAAMAPSSSRLETMGVGSPLTVYARAEDDGTGVDEDTYVLEISRDPTFLNVYSYGMGPHPDQVNYPGWYQVTVDLKNDPLIFPPFSPGEYVAWRVRCTDLAGNVGYSGVTEGRVDGIPPQITSRASAYNDDVTTDAGKMYEEIKGNVRIRLTVNDASAIKTILFGFGDPPATWTKIWDRDGTTDNVLISYLGKYVDGYYSSAYGVCYFDPDNETKNVWVFDANRILFGRRVWSFKVTDIFENTGIDRIEIKNLAKDTQESEPTTEEVVEDLKNETESPDVHGTHIMINTIPTDRLAGEVESIAHAEGSGVSRIVHRMRATATGILFEKEEGADSPTVTSLISLLGDGTINPISPFARIGSDTNPFWYGWFDEVRADWVSSISDAWGIATNPDGTCVMYGTFYKGIFQLLESTDNSVTIELDEVSKKIDLKAVGGGTGTTGYVDRIQQPDDETNRVQVANGAGSIGGVSYGAGDVLVLQGGEISVLISSQGTISGYNGGTKVWELDYAGRAMVGKMTAVDDITSSAEVDSDNSVFRVTLAGDKVLEVGVDGSLVLFDSTGSKQFEITPAGGVHYYGGASSAVWGIGDDGVAYGIKIGFKSG